MTQGELDSLSPLVKMNERVVALAAKLQFAASAAGTLVFKKSARLTIG